MSRLNRKNNSVPNTDNIKVIELTTGWWIDKDPNVPQRELFAYMSVPDYYSNLPEPFGYLEFDNKIALGKIPKETLMSLLTRDLNYKFIEAGFAPPNKLSSVWKMKNTLFEQQEKVRQDVLKYFKDWSIDKARYRINMPTGKGKTYVTSQLIADLGYSALVIVKNKDLMMNFYNTLRYETLGINRKNIVAASNPVDILELKEKGISPDVLIVTHGSLLSLIKTYGRKKLIQYFLKMGFGTKIYDEFDYNTTNMFRLDTLTTIKYNIYLSATINKTNRKQDKLFQEIFESSPLSGKEYYKENRPTKSLDLYFCKKQHIEKRDYARVMMGAGQIERNAYHLFVHETEEYKAWLHYIMKDKIGRSYKEGKKVFLFLGRTKSTWLVRDLLVKEFKDLNISASDVLVYNSKVVNQRPINTYSQPIVCTTSRSLGRGIDLKGLTYVINSELLLSRPYTEQAYGRVGRNGLSGHIYDFIITNFGRVSLKKQNVIKSLAKDDLDETRLHKFLHEENGKIETFKELEWEGDV